MLSNLAKEKVKVPDWKAPFYKNSSKKKMWYMLILLFFTKPLYFTNC